jgi:hypothetical protein
MAKAAVYQLFPKSVARMQRARRKQLRRTYVVMLIASG